MVDRRIVTVVGEPTLVDRLYLAGSISETQYLAMMWFSDLRYRAIRPGPALPNYGGPGGREIDEDTLILWSETQKAVIVASHAGLRWLIEILEGTVPPPSQTAAVRAAILALEAFYAHRRKNHLQSQPVADNLTSAPQVRPPSTRRTRGGRQSLSS